MMRTNGTEDLPMPEQKSETGAKVLLTFIALPAAIFAHGYTISTLWAWFIIPIFGLPEIGVLEAAAMLLFINYFVAKPDKDVDIMSSKLSLDNYMANTLTNIVLKPLVALSIGWILKELIA